MEADLLDIIISSRIFILMLFKVRENDFYAAGFKI